MLVALLMLDLFTSLYILPSTATRKQQSNHGDSDMFVLFVSFLNYFKLNSNSEQTAKRTSWL